MEQVEGAYDKVFPDGLPPEKAGEFTAELEACYARFLDRTKKRPIKPRDVKAAQRILREECREAMRGMR